MESYSDIVLDHAENPRNVGPLEGANARGYQMNPVCGDTLVLQLRIENEVIAEAKFQTEGCTASVATSSLFTELITGKTLAEAEAISYDEVTKAMGGLPASKLHSAALVVGALRQAIASYRQAAAT
jgi:nitrogen fixation NifU-like protein